jgi:hypothetical protein
MDGRQLHWVVTALAVLLCAAASSPAGTTETIDSWIVRFEAIPHSMWSEQPPTYKTFSWPKEVGDENPTFKGTQGSFEGHIATGRVDGNVEGEFRVTYDASVTGPSQVPVTIEYVPLEGESQIHGTLGASLEVEGRSKANYIPSPKLPPVTVVDTTLDITTPWGKPNEIRGARSQQVWVLAS